MSALLLVSCMGIEEFFFSFFFLLRFSIFFPIFVEGILPLIFYILSTISEEEHVNLRPFIHAHAPQINSTRRTDEQLRMNEYTMEGVFGLTLFIYLLGYGLVVKGETKISNFLGKRSETNGEYASTMISCTIICHKN